MSGQTSTLAEIARLSGSEESDIAEHLEEAGLLRTDGGGTRLAHLVGAAQTSREGALAWRLERLETAIREGLDQTPPKGHDGACGDAGALALSTDERVLLSSGWTFDARRDQFEADLLGRVGAALASPRPPSAASWHDGSLFLVDADGVSARVEAEMHDDVLRLGIVDEAPHSPIAPTGPDDPAIEGAMEADPSEAAPADPPAPSPEPCTAYDPNDRQSAWSEAMSRFRRSGAAATATAYAAGLRMNDSTREALLRGGIPTDHVLFAICAAMGVRLDVERGPKGSSGDPAHYPRLAAAIARRQAMAAVPDPECGPAAPVEATSASPAPPDDAPGSTVIRRSDAGDALLRILSSARSDDVAIAGLRRRSEEIRADASAHRRRAEAAEPKVLALEDAIADVRRVVEKV